MKTLTEIVAEGYRRSREPTVLDDWERRLAERVVKGLLGTNGSNGHREEQR